MSKLLEFFRSKNLERKFSRLGEGKKLIDSSSEENAHQQPPVPIEAPRRVITEASACSSKAADAAMERLNQRNRKPDRSFQNDVKRELEQARREEQEAATLKDRFTQKVITQEKPSVLSKVLFWCPSLFGNSVIGTREEVEQAIDQYLQSETTQNLPEAATLILIRSLQLAKPPVSPDIPLSEQPTPTEWREKRKQNFARILTNLIQNPDNPTFRRLRCGNQLVSDLLSIKGAEIFFTACNFTQQSLPAPKPVKTDDVPTDEELATPPPPDEPFLVISEQAARDTAHLQRMLDLLNTAEPILADLYRDTKVYILSANASAMLSKEQLPDEYFCLSREEAKRLMEQQQRIIEESGLLLTKAMRERLRVQEIRLFRYALIRVRLPGNWIIQGTFYASDTVASVRAWISECLAVPSTEYQLWAPPGTLGSARSNAPPTARVELTRDTATLVECGLAPCSLLTLSVSHMSGARVTPEPGSPTPPPLLLRPELMSNVSNL